MARRFASSASDFEGCSSTYKALEIQWHRTRRSCTSSEASTPGSIRQETSSSTSSRQDKESISTLPFGSLRRPSRHMELLCNHDRLPEFLTSQDRQPMPWSKSAYAVSHHARMDRRTTKIRHSRPDGNLVGRIEHLGRSRKTASAAG